LFGKNNHGDKPLARGLWHSPISLKFLFLNTGRAVALYKYISYSIQTELHSGLLLAFAVARASAIKASFKFLE